MRQRIVSIFIVISFSSCATIPTKVKGHVNKCEISSDKKTLKIIDVAKETHTYYSLSGLILTPIIIPTTTIVSGSYILVNNIYNLAEEKIVCGED